MASCGLCILVTREMMDLRWTLLEDEEARPTSVRTCDEVGFLWARIRVFADDHDLLPVDYACSIVDFGLRWATAVEHLDREGIASIRPIEGSYVIGCEANDVRVVLTSYSSARTRTIYRRLAVDRVQFDRASLAFLRSVATAVLRVIPPFRFCCDLAPLLVHSVAVTPRAIAVLRQSASSRNLWESADVLHAVCGPRLGELLDAPTEPDAVAGVLQILASDDGHAAQERGRSGGASGGAAALIRRHTGPDGLLSAEGRALVEAYRLLICSQWAGASTIES